MTISLQKLSDCGLNPFAVQLLWESWSRHETQQRRRVAFPFQGDVIAIMTLDDWKASGPVGWHDQPPEPGIYYQETCDDLGRPRPGLAYWEPGTKWQPSELPTKYFGPIRGAMQDWPTVPANGEAE